MRRVALAVFLVSLPSFAGIVSPDCRREIRERGWARVIVTTHDGSLPALTSDEFVVTAHWRHAGAFAGVMRASAIVRLEADPNVWRADLDSGGSGGLAESVPLIGGNIVHAMGFTGKGVTVAILDSGADSTHPDLAGRIVDEQCFCASGTTGCCPNGSAMQSGAGAAADDHGHGTNVAGIVGSKGTVSSPGVAPDVKIVAVKVLDRNNRFSSTAQVISGLEWVYDNHPEVRVINMSLGTDAVFTDYCDASASFTAAFGRVIDLFRARGTVVFVSSGNNGSSTAMQSPACVRNAISVGATYDAAFAVINAGPVCSDSPAAVDQITCFTNSNATLDLLAPGAVITSTGLGGGRSTYLGTSQAAPHCAGAAAVLLQVQPALKPEQIESLLKVTGKPIFDPRNGTITPRIDLLGAVQAIVYAHPRRRAAAH